MVDWSFTIIDIIIKVNGFLPNFETYMTKMQKYTVAGHTFAVCLHENFSSDDILSPYIPFIESGEKDPLFTLTLSIVPSLKDVAIGKVLQCLNDEAPYFWLFEDEDDKYSFGFSYTRNCPDCILVVSDDFKQNIVYVREASSARHAEFAMSNSMMLLYTFCTTPLETLMVHASVVAHGGAAYMFLGRSGTGKSTHSRLWLEHIQDTYLLNDDNPVIRMIDGQAYIYGTPWSGKTPCYKNERHPLRAVVRLSQAPYNKITRFAPLQAFASLMPSCSCMRWDSPSVSALHKTVEKVIGVVPGYGLECLPDKAAADLCHSTVTR